MTNNKNNVVEFTFDGGNGCFTVAINTPTGAYKAARDLARRLAASGHTSFIVRAVSASGRTIRSWDGVA